METANTLYVNNALPTVDMEATGAEKRRTLADILRANTEIAVNLNERADWLLRFLTGKEVEPKEQKNAGCMFEEADMLAESLSVLSRKFRAIEEVFLA